MTTVDKIKSLIELRDNGVDCQNRIDALVATLNVTEYINPIHSAHAETVESLY
jgi:hypothetical protein